MSARGLLKGIFSSGPLGTCPRGIGNRMRPCAVTSAGRKVKTVMNDRMVIVGVAEMKRWED